MLSPLYLELEVTEDEVADPAVGPLLAVLDAVCCHGSRCAAFEHAALERAVEAVRGARRGVRADQLLMASRASRSKAVCSDDEQAAALLRAAHDVLEQRESPLWVWHVLGAGQGDLAKGDIFGVVDLARAELAGPDGVARWLENWTA